MSRDRVDLAGDVDHVLVVEAADDVDDRVGLADVGQELVAEALALGRAGDQAGDVDELDDRRDDPLGLDDRRQLRQARIGQLDHADVRLDGAERVVLGRDAGFGEGVEEGGLADVGQAHDAAFEAHGRLRELPGQSATGILVGAYTAATAPFGDFVTQLQTLAPHPRDLGGGFMVRRLLPSADRRAVGPFVFFDHFGPIDVAPGAHHDVRPHPHIGLATLTYLFEGAIMHRDSTGVVQRIEPGAVNWMSAGRGIVHSERTPKDLLDRAHRTHGLQLWVALPEALEDAAPSFQHLPAQRIPRVRVPGATVHVIAGSAFGETSPVAISSPTLALVLDFDVASSVRVALPPATPPSARSTPSTIRSRSTASPTTS